LKNWTPQGRAPKIKTKGIAMSTTVKGSDRTRCVSKRVIPPAMTREA